MARLTRGYLEDNPDVPDIEYCREMCRMLPLLVTATEHMDFEVVSEGGVFVKRAADYWACESCESYIRNSVGKPAPRGKEAAA